MTTLTEDELLTAQQCREERRDSIASTKRNRRKSGSSFTSLFGYLGQSVDTTSRNPTSGPSNGSDVAPIPQPEVKPKVSVVPGKDYLDSRGRVL